MLFSEKVKRLRKRLNKSQREFGEYFGYGKASVNRWESGKGEPGSVAIKRSIDLVYNRYFGEDDD